MKQLLLALTICALTDSALFADTVESERNLPVIDSVDVLVVGGTMGGVGAAISAKESGASVFLVAPRFHLGEDVVQPRRLWLGSDSDGGSDEFIMRTFNAFASTPFTYVTDVTPNASHPDNNSSVLTDGVWESSANQSVQYNSDVRITATLTDPNRGKVKSVTVFSFYRADVFDMDSMSVAVSGDNVTYTPGSGSLTLNPNSSVLVKDSKNDPIKAWTFTFNTPVDANYVQIACTKLTSRMLLGELFITTENCLSSAATPVQVEQSLDAALVGAGVPFLTGSMPVGTVSDANGKTAGVVIANRSGRQVVLAKTVIDATTLAAVARGKGVELSAGSADPIPFSRTVICQRGTVFSLPSGYTVEQLPFVQTVTIQPTDLQVAGAPTSMTLAAYRITASFPMPVTSYSALSDLEQQFRDATWTESTVDAAETLDFVPVDTITGVAKVSVWTGSSAFNLDALKPVGNDYLYVLGPNADVSYAVAAKLSMPVNAYFVGKRLGVAAAAAAVARGALGDVIVGVAFPTTSARVCERLSKPLNVGSDDAGMVFSCGDVLPTLKTVDVAVVGAGTAGAPAAIAAARQGKSVLIMDVLHNMGGSSTDSCIGRYYKGNVRGFTSELDAGVDATGWVFYAAKSEWLRRQCRTAGAEVWYGAFAQGVVTDGTDAAGRAKVTGVVVALPDGTRGVVNASVVVDSTGNADLSAAAGAGTQYLDVAELAMQGATLSKQQLANSYINYDVGFLNDTDAGDLTFFALRGRLAYTSFFTFGSPYTASRERRRIIGDVVVSPLDVLCGKTYSDTIMHGTSNFDMHGYTTSEVFMFFNHTQNMSFNADLPFRALLPRDLDGVIATGLGVSAHRDAMPIIRMQADVQNQGYAAGLAAAAAVDVGCVRNISVPDLQRQLVAIGALEERVLSDADSTVTVAQVQNAVDGLATDFIGLQYILSAPDVALPLLRSAYQSAASDDRLNALSCALALLGDSTGNERLLNLLASGGLVGGTDFKGMGNYGRATSFNDAVVYALAKAGNLAFAPLLEGLFNSLSAQSKLSNVRMCTLAAEMLRDKDAAAAAVTALQNNPSWVGEAMTAPVSCAYESGTDDAERNAALRELAIGRMLYRLDDQDGVGRTILEKYAGDSRGLYAQYARMVLDSEPISNATASVSGSWISGQSNDSWSNPAAWANGDIANGTSATATFTGDGSARTVDLGGEVQIGSLQISGSGIWTFTNGMLYFGGMESELNVASGAAVNFDVPVSVFQLDKTGAGTAKFTDTLAVLSEFNVSEGVVEFNNGSKVYQPFSAVVESSVMGDDPRGYGYDFTVQNGPLWVTHLGCYDSTGAGFVKTMRTLVASGGTILTAMEFSPASPGFLRNGYRFQRLPVPLKLADGMYRIQTYGFAGEQACSFRIDGEPIGEVDDCDGMINFGTELYTGTSERNIYTETVDGAGAYAATVASLLVTKNNPEQVFAGNLDVDATVVIASPTLQVGGLSGSGTVVTTTNDCPVTLVVDSDSDTVFSGTLAENGSRLGLTKSGNGTLTLSGRNYISDAIYVKGGALNLATADAIPPDTPLVFGDAAKEISRGYLSVLEDDVELSHPIWAAKMLQYNQFDFGLSLQGAQSLTLRDTAILSPDVIATAGNDACMTFVVPASLDGVTTLYVDNVVSDYIDFNLRLDGLAGGNADNAVYINNLSAPNGLRKLVAFNSVAKTAGGSLTLDNSSLHIDYIDLSGYNVNFEVTGGSTVEVPNLRMANTGWGGQTESNAKMLVSGGSRLIGAALPNSVYNTTNSVFAFNDAVFQIYNDDITSWINLSDANPPAQILSGGLTVDLMSKQLGASRSIRVRHPITTPAGETSGPLTINGVDGDVGDFKVSAELSILGPITVKDGGLWLDHTVAPGTTMTSLLTTRPELNLTGSGYLKMVPKNNGDRELFSVIRAAVEGENPEPSEVEVDGDGEVVTAALVGTPVKKTGSGVLTVQLDGDSSDSVLSAPIIVSQGTLKVNANGETVEPTLVTDGGFEPSPALSGDAPNLDRRGNRNSSYFASNLTSWSFAKTDNVGISRVGGYFESTSTTEGAHFAFLRSNSGNISRTITVSKLADYTLKFDYASRFYNNTTYKGAIEVQLDGIPVLQTGLFQDKTWVTAEIPLGKLTAGTHTLTFKPGANNADSLFDNVRIGYSCSFDPSLLAQRISDKLNVELTDTGKLFLDFSGSCKVGYFFLNGERQFGVFNATTMPEFISGEGSFYCYPLGSLIIFR